MTRIESNPSKTVLTIVVGFAVVFWFTGWMWAFKVLVVVGLAGIFSNYLARKIEWVWMKLAFILGKIIPNILMSLIFFLILYPIALLSRAFGEKDPLKLKNSYSSMFKTTDKVFDKASFERPW